MDAAQALADLTEISSQVVDVAIVDEDGTIMATTADDVGRAERFVDGHREAARAGRGAARVARACRTSPSSRRRRSTAASSSSAATGRVIAATTRPDPTVGLVFYDLKHCLRSIEDGPPPPEEQRAPSASRKKADASA